MVTVNRKIKEEKTKEKKKRKYIKAVVEKGAWISKNSSIICRLVRGFWFILSFERWLILFGFCGLIHLSFFCGRKLKIELSVRYANLIDRIAMPFVLDEFLVLFFLFVGDICELMQSQNLLYYWKGFAMSGTWIAFSIAWM